jgi:ribosomal protein RSM22 (predicted rRNA methylase)
MIVLILNIVNIFMLFSLSLSLSLSLSVSLFLYEQADWDTYQPTLKREEYARLLRSPLKGTGHITMDLCLPNGHLHRYVHARSEVEALPRLYNAMRKVSWGGLLPAFMIEPTYTTMMRTRTTKQVGKDEKLMKRSSGGERRSRRQGHGDDNDIEEQEAMKKALEAFLAAEKQQEQGKTSSSNKRVNVTDSDNINAIMRQMAVTDESAAVGRSRGGANRRRSSLSSRKEA